MRKNLVFLFFILLIPFAFLCTGGFYNGLFAELKKPDYEGVSQANVLLLSAIREDFGVSVYLKEKPDDVINIETVYSFEPVQEIDNTYLNRYLRALIKVFKKYRKYDILISIKSGVNKCQREEVELT